MVFIICIEPDVFSKFCFDVTLHLFAKIRIDKSSSLSKKFSIFDSSFVGISLENNLDA